MGILLSLAVRTRMSLIKAHFVNLQVCAHSEHDSNDNAYRVSTLGLRVQHIEVVEA